MDEPQNIYIGLDYAESAICKARIWFPFVAWHVHDITRPLASLLDWHCSTALCIETLEHITEYRAALHNIFQSLKPGGVALFTVPNNDGLKQHVNHWTLDTFTDLMRQYGEAEVSLFHGGNNLIAKVVKR